jgi:hypothetical protein
VRLLPVFLVLPAAGIVMVLALPLATPLLPHVFDSTVIDLDGTLGFQPASAAAWLFSLCPPVKYVCSLVYIWLPATLAWSIGLEMRSLRRPGMGALPIFLFAGVLGYALYFLMPVVGPRPFLGPDFPNLLYLASPVSGHADFSPTPRNCVPSMHTAWAALAFLATRNQAWVFRAVSLLFMICTMLATLGLGQHYVTDLVVAAPFVLLVRGICAVQVGFRRERLGAVATGCLCLVAWCGVIRGGLPSWFMPMVPAAMLATIVVSVWFEQGLADAERRRHVDLPISSGMRGVAEETAH